MRRGGTHAQAKQTGSSQEGQERTIALVAGSQSIPASGDGHTTVGKQGTASRVATRAITFYVSEERFRTLDLARRALRDRPTWSVLGNGWADQWLASLPDEVFRISR